MNIPLENLEILQKNVNELKKENQELKDTNMKYAKLIDDFQTKNMRLEKAIEIIKEKGIDYHSISAIKQSKDYEDYLDLVKNLITLVFKLTKEEYELLKEVLENEI